MPQKTFRNASLPKSASFEEHKSKQYILPELKDISACVQSVYLFRYRCKSAKNGATRPPEPSESLSNTCRSGNQAACIAPVLHFFSGASSVIGTPVAKYKRAVTPVCSSAYVDSRYLSDTDSERDRAQKSMHCPTSKVMSWKDSDSVTPVSTRTACLAASACFLPVRVILGNPQRLEEDRRTNAT